MQQTLASVFGFSALKQGQQTVIEALLAGRSAAAIFPTGSGKSLCYQLPALLLPHLTLVISPLLALMQDQLEFLKSKGIAASSIDSAQSADEQRRIYQAIKTGEIKILMISVERLKNERFRHFISQIPISLLVVDEAHCISEWGHNFRPDYLKLPTYQTLLAIKQVLLLTATATPAVVKDMAQKFAIREHDIVRTGFYRPNLTLHVEPVSAAERFEVLCQRLRPYQHLSSIVYVTQQQSAEELAKALEAQGFKACAYHAGLTHEVRQRLQARYMQGEILTMVATIAFGMGIDKSDIRAIVHYDLPKSIENFSQEIGRAGRDGHTADCLVLANRESENLLANFIYGDTPEPSALLAVLNEINEHPEPHWPVMLSRLSTQANIRQLPLKTLLVQLELQGFIEPVTSYFARYRFKLLVDEATLLERFDQERVYFLKRLLASAQKARLWYSLDFAALSFHQLDRTRAVKALDYLADQGLIELETGELTEVFHKCQPFDPKVQADALYQYFADKERAELARIEHMLALFNSPECLSSRLARYFGDQEAPAACGHCSVCLGHFKALQEPLPLKPLSAFHAHELLHTFNRSYRQNTGISPSIACQTRFLCAINMPLFTVLRARAMPHFGALKAYSYPLVRQWLTQSP